MPAPEELGNISTSFTAKTSAWQVRQSDHAPFNSKKKKNQLIHQLQGTAPQFEIFMYFRYLPS